MATHLKNLSITSLESQGWFSGLNIAIVVADWNPRVTHSMRDAAINFLVEKGVPESQIFIHPVPGTFELPLGAQWAAQLPTIHAVIAIGCVIQGETRHFDFICDACANGIKDVSLKFNKPVIFGVLTTQNLEQALDRSGGKHGNKGIEAAETALSMCLLYKSLNETV